MTDSKRYFFSVPLPIPAKRRGDILLMLDFDGTLVPIMDDPAQCYPSREVSRYLSLISREKGFYVAIVSGRALSDITRRIPVKGLYFSGSHGLEISGPELTYVHPDALRVKPAIDRLRKLAEKEMGGMEGLLIERKPFSFCLHYRMMRQQRGRLILTKLKGLILQSMMDEEVSVITGKKVVEVVPHGNWDKGCAARFIMEGLPSKATPVYVGDDRTDEFAFRALKEAGITVRIGRSARSSASYYLRNQNEIVSFLDYVHNMRNSAETVVCGNSR